MLTINAIPVTAEVITDTNVIADEADWMIGATYAEFDTANHVGHVWESLQSGNLGHEPGATGSEDYWLDRGADNVMRAFDRSPSSYSEAEDEVFYEWTLPADRFADAIACKLLAGTSVQVTVTDAVEGVVYDRTLDLIAPDSVVDWYGYFFDPIEQVDYFALTDLPPYDGAVITLTVLNPGADARIGLCVFGEQFQLGDTQWGPKGGIQDYSRIETNDFGETDIAEGSFADRGSFALNVPSNRVDIVKRFLTANRATPLMFIGDPRFGATFVYGTAREFEVEITGPDQSLCTLETMGLA